MDFVWILQGSFFLGQHHPDAGRGRISDAGGQRLCHHVYFYVAVVFLFPPQNKMVLDDHSGDGTGLSGQFYLVLQAGMECGVWV